MTEILLKALGPSREPINGGIGQWPYRKWTEPVKPIPCEQGYHVCTPAQMVRWLPDTRNHIWVVEVRGELVDREDKMVAESARLVRRLEWTDYAARMFAADCAEAVLPIFEKEQPNDDRPRKAIEAARQFAAGETAAGDAAWAAAGDAAWAAAWAARAAARAAGDAAWAAGAAAWAAGAARAARAAQGELLLKWLGVDDA